MDFIHVFSCLSLLQRGTTPAAELHRLHCVFLTLERLSVPSVRKGKSDTIYSISNQQRCMEYHKLIIRLKQHANATHLTYIHSLTITLRYNNDWISRCIRFSLSKERHGKATYIRPMNAVILPRRVRGSIRILKKTELIADWNTQ